MFTRKSLVFAAFGLGVFAMPSGASAHRVYHVDGNLNVIVCDGGEAYTFYGSGGGANEAAGLLCAAIRGPSNPVGTKGKDVILMGSASAALEAKIKPAGDVRSPGSDVPGSRLWGYPPHGYPCLGCVRCPPSFCDDGKGTIIVASGTPVVVDEKFLSRKGMRDRFAGGTNTELMKYSRARQGLDMPGK